MKAQNLAEFPFLFGGTFIEGTKQMGEDLPGFRFPFLFGGTFIEGIPGDLTILVLS